MTCIRTFRFRMLPRKAQHRALHAALTHTRDLYNAALEERIGAYQKLGIRPGYPAQCKALTELRSDAAFAIYPVSMQRWPLKRLDLAFRGFFARLKRGERPGFPRYRGRNWFNSFGFSDCKGWNVTDDRLHVKGIGRVRLHLHRALPSKPISCQIKRDAKGWVALLVCEVALQPLPTTEIEVAIEDLNVRGLARGVLARDVNDAGWSSFVKLLIEKAERAGRTVAKVDPRNTSQACSACGEIVQKPLSQRVHSCACGFTADRDHNAALNILKRAVAGPLQLNVGGCAVRAA